MTYSYKVYPHSKTATNLSTMGKGIIGVGFATLLMLCAKAIVPNLLNGMKIKTESLITYAVCAVVLSIIGIILLAVAKHIGLKAEQNALPPTQCFTSDVTSDENYTGHTAPHGDVPPQRFENEDDAKKYIKKRLLVNKKGLIFLFILTALFITSLFFGFFPQNSSMQNPTQFTNVSEDDGYYYTDILWISNWLYKYDDSVYYVAQDKSFNLLVIRVNDVDFEKLSKQYDYFLSTDEDEVAPEPYRLYGIRENLTSSIKENICEATDIPQSEFSEKFGNSYLDTTTTPARESSFFWFFAAFMLGLLDFAVLSGWVTRIRNFNQSIKTLKESEKLISAAAELSSYSEECFNKKNKTIITEHYLFSVEMSVAVLITDIILCYKRVSGAGNLFCIYTKYWKDKPVTGITNDAGLFESWRDYIVSVNPSVLIGKNNENISIYNNRKNS